MTTNVATATPQDVGADWQRLYRDMARGREFDRLALALQRQGAIDSYAESTGQEAAQVGATVDLEPGDMVFPSYRQPTVAMARGVPASALLGHYAGLGYCTWDWREHAFAPYCIPVGSQLAHATGWAWASRLRGEDRVTVVFLGDGASSQGEVHEAMNYAGVFDAPVVFVLENNGWAISLPTVQQTRAESFHARAAGYGIAGVRVDGNDVAAVRAVARDAVARARAGGGPTLIEAVTFRIGGHTSSDDPKRYRDPGEVERWRERDPIALLRAAVADLPDVAEELAAIDREIAAELEREVDAFLVKRGKA